MTFADLSTRFPSVDFVDAHRRLGVDERRCRAAGAGTEGLGPLSLLVDEAAVTLRPGASVSIVDGVEDDATCVVRFASAQTFADFFHELRSVTGVQLAGGIAYERGGYGDRRRLRGVRRSPGLTRREGDVRSRVPPPRRCWPLRHRGHGADASTRRGTTR